MMRWMIPLALLAGCDGGNVGKDGYRYEGAEYLRHEVAVRVVIHADLHELQRAGSAAGARVEFQRELQAFALLEPDGCTIHMIDPSQRYRPEWIGHELTHCIFGRWHK